MSAAGATLEMSSEIMNQHIQSADVCVESLLKPEEIPAWLNEAFIEEILQKFSRNENLKVKSLQIQQCGGKGDSYASIMYRVGTFFVSGKNPDTPRFRSYIVKTLPEAAIAIEKLGAGNFNVQNKEMEMYQQILPEFSRLLESINEDPDIFPKALGVDKALDVIVLEDLAEKKFVMEDRQKGLDLDHILLALRKLARMHAASAMVNEKDPEKFAHLDTGFFTRKTDCFNVMFESLCDAMIEEVETWEGFEYYATKFKNVRKNLIDNARRAFDCDEGDLHVLNHGDLWTNNLMFNYDEAGALADCVLLDFQFANFGSPALDLIYFLYTSTFDDLRVEKMEELLQFYYYELRDLLTRLGFGMKKFPSLQAFHVQILKKYFYAFTSGLLIFGVMISKDKDADFETLMSLDDRAMGFKRRVFKSPRYQAVVKKLFPIFDAKGIFDEM